MAISSRLFRDLQRLIWNIGRDSGTAPEEGNVVNYGAVKTFITIPKGTQLIPIMVEYNLSSYRMARQSDVNLVVPLYVGTTRVHRTVDSCLRALLMTSARSGLTKVVTSKGEVFYGGYGLILDTDLEPIFLIVSKDTYRVLDNTVPVYKEIYIDPRVFTLGNIVYKGIVEKLIPFFTDDQFKIPIIITKIAGFSKPQLINNSLKETEKQANEFLVNALAGEVSLGI